MILPFFQLSKQVLGYIVFAYFYINGKNIGLVQILDFRFLMDLHILGCPERDLTISGKCLWVCVSVSLCVCDKNFVASIARELMTIILWNFIFSITPTEISVHQLLLKIVQEMALQSNIFQIFLGCADLGFYWMKLYKNLHRFI